MLKRYLYVLLIASTTASCTSSDQALQPSEPHATTIVGEMRKVMRDGKLEGTIRLDTIAKREHLYGLGPLAYLKGEITVMDGVAYRSVVLPDSSIVVDTTYAMEAPFFGYANIPSWIETALPDSVRTLTDIEQYLDIITKDRQRPYFFRLVGTVADAFIHVVNLPDGSVVTSPDEAHVGQVDYHIKDTEAELLGFFSTEHKAVFTHHDTFVHIHLITADRSMMGHVDALVLGSGVRLYLGD